MNGLTIGRMAKKAGVTIDTVRFYERRGLIAEPPRSAANYRLYPEEDADRLRFIRHAKDLGFSLNEIKELLNLRHDPAATKADVKHCAEAKIKDIKQKIKDLSNILAALEPLTATCNGHGPVSECPILEALETDQNHHHHGGERHDEHHAQS
ncbi:MAG: heavy metal-responsive transcriptional regulator [Deltaproteobacteria bacterium]|nr:heavy metal-responsive transcriptional regulator [Deltaproteobacteria bacterium]